MERLYLKVAAIGYICYIYIIMTDRDPVANNPNSPTEGSEARGGALEGLTADELFEVAYKAQETVYRNWGIMLGMEQAGMHRDSGEMRLWLRNQMRLSTEAESRLSKADLKRLEEALLTKYPDIFDRD